MKLHTKLMLLTLLIGCTTNPFLNAARDKRVIKAYNMIQQGFLRGDLDGEAARRSQMLAEAHQRPYIAALATANTALPAGIRQAAAQEQFDNLETIRNPLQRAMLRLAYAFIWTQHPDNPTRTNLDPGIDMTTLCNVDQAQHSIMFDFAGLVGNDNAPTLQQLLIDLACASNYTYVTLQNIMPTSTPLTIFTNKSTALSLANNTRLTKTPLILAQNLRTLVVNDCTALTAIPMLPNLENLNANNCTALRAIPPFPRLRSLHARSCTSLQAIPLLPDLRALVVDDCTALTRIPTLPNLGSLDINRCTALPAIPALPLLQTLDANDCTALIERGDLPLPGEFDMLDVPSLDALITANRTRLGLATQ